MGGFKNSPIFKRFGTTTGGGSTLFILKGCTGYPDFFISGIRPDIHLPDIRLDNQINYWTNNANFEKQNFLEPFQCVQNKEWNSDQVSRFCQKQIFFLHIWEAAKKFFF